MLYGLKELDIEKTEMVELMAIGANVNWKLCWLTQHLGGWNGAWFTDYSCNLYVHDPITKLGDAWRKYGITLNKWEELPRYVDAMVATASHAEYFAQSRIILLDK